MQKRYEPLITAAAQARQNGVGAWEELVRAMAEVYAYEREACVIATPETLARVQGRALMMREILEVLRDAPAHYATMTKRGS
jgi:hypothetical protein